MARRLAMLSLILTVGVNAAGPVLRGGGVPLACSSGQIEFVPLSIGSFEVTWTLNVQGYGGYAHLELRERYEVTPRRLGWWESAEGKCLALMSLVYKGGEIVKAEGANSAGDPAAFGYDGRKPSTVDPGAVVCKRSDYFDIRLAPSIKALNTAAEEALGCWGENWPVMRISPAALRDLALNKKTIKWEGPAMNSQDREVAPGCQAGLARIELYGSLPKIIDSATCKDYGGTIAAPAKGEASKRCKNGAFDGFQIIE